ncbi:unnamed protein product [Ostreobium quekettii]|uniref:Peptidase S1 domain-containing protein n=1 Tax=Ostreobium quekettii TaxID=121088 RepID=A0A8S1IUA4_9CHLO|nr:unnamed protein product [Ostreobium quekettii]
MRRWCAGEGGLHAPSCLLPRTDQVHPYPTTKSQSGNLVRRADVVMGLRGGSGRACGGEKGYSGKAPGTSPKNLHDVRMLRTRQKTQTGVLHALLLLALLSMDGSVGEQRQDLTPLQCDTEGLQRSSEDACSAVIEESFKNESTGVGPFIKGGKTAELERFPYFVRLLKQASLEHACGGILIDAWHVLTAAHCQNSTGNNPLAYVGRMQEFVGVKTMILHPKWNGIVADGHDIALARLLRSVENVKFPVLSPPKTKYIHGTVVSALGWNESMDWWNPRAIDIADTLWVVDHDRCYGDVKKDLKPGMICAYSWKMRPCPGDSGGPLLIAHDDAGSIMNGNPQGDIVIGIVSFGSVICDTKIEHLSTAYTDVSEYALWIQEVKNSWNPEVFWLGGAVAIVAIVCTCYKCQDNPTQPDVPAHCGNRPLQRSVLVRQTTQDSLRGVAELFRDSYMGVAALQELPAQVLEPVSIGVARAMLSRRQKRMPNHFVTVSGKVQAIMDLLRLPATTTVALSGMGGVGKSTLAMAVYNETIRSPELGEAVWLRIGRAPKCPRSLLVEIWNKLGGQEQDLYGEVDDILEMIQNALEHRCLLLVLDDVWDAAHVEKLMVISNTQSRVLMTSRRTSLAKQVDINAKTFNVEVLDAKASHELFCRFAFGAAQVPSSKQSSAHIVDEMVQLCGQLPLALRIIGRMAAGFQTEHEWRHALKKLKQSQERAGEMESVLSTLKVSYDDLDKDHKLMICCLVCYPEGCHVKLTDLVEHWMALQQRDFGEGFEGNNLSHDAVAVLYNLRDRSLLHVEDKEGEQWRDAVCHMHGLVREMGIIAAKGDLPDMHNIALSLPISTDERDHAQCTHSLILREYLMPTLPPLLLTWVHLKVLDLSGSRLETLCGGVQDLAMLEVLRLDRCSLKTLPDEVTNLRQLGVLSLRGCWLLTCLPVHLGSLSRLHSLYLQDCWALEYLPQTLTQLQDLHNFDLAHCRQLLSLPTGLQCLSNIEFLSLGGCSRLEMSLGMQNDPLRREYSLIDAIVSMNYLQWLDLHGLDNLKHIPDALGHHLARLRQLDLSGCSSLEAIPRCIGRVTNIRTLNLASCSRLANIPEAIEGLVQLQHLDFSHCSNLKHLPKGIGCLTQLRRLDLNGCSQLQDIPESIQSLSQINSLNLSGCCCLSSLPAALAALVHLRFLSLSGCLELTEVPLAIWSLKQLRHLDLSGCRFSAPTPGSASNEEIPDAIGGLGHLGTLILNGCTTLTQLPTSIGSLTHLRTFLLTGCTKLERIPKEVGLLSRLKTLDLSGCSRLKALPEVGAGSWQHLQTLDLSGCSSLASLPPVMSFEQLRGLFLSECTSLSSLPDSLASLRHLRIVDLRGCSNLKALPGDATWLSQLQRLDIDGCCELEKKFGQNDRPGKGYRTFTRVLTLKQYFVRAFTRPIPKSRYQTPCRVDRLREWRDAFGRKGKKGKGVLLQRSPPVRTQQHYAQLQRSTVLPQDTFQEWLEAIGVKPRRANAATPTLQQSPPLRSRK